MRSTIALKLRTFGTRAGRLWKFLSLSCAILAFLTIWAALRESFQAVMCVDLQDHHSNYFPQRAIGDIDFKVNAGSNIGDWLTPNAILSRGRLIGTPAHWRLPRRLLSPEYH